MQSEIVDVSKPNNTAATTPQPTPNIRPDINGDSPEIWPTIESRDYVNAFIFNEAGQGMVLERQQNGNAWGSWQTIGRYLEEDENPLTAVQQALLECTGYHAKQWTYLGSFVVDDAGLLGVGHFFCARGVSRIASPDPCEPPTRWVERNQIKQALLDGRIASINYAIAATMALVMCDKY